MLAEVASIQGRFPERARVCIFGSGPAGMTVAERLAARGHAVFLVEAGGTDYDPESQEFYQGTVIGDHYFDLDEARLRMFGGSSNHWAGWCRPLDELDYQRITGRQLAWPIDASELSRFTAGACEILEIPAEFGSKPLTDSLRTVQFQISGVNFGVKYAELCRDSDRIRLFLDSMLVGMRHNGRAIEGAIIKRSDGSTYELEADYFVMALGGIENSRILKWINASNNKALVASDDLIGRYWMEHPHIVVGDAILLLPEEELFPAGGMPLVVTVSEARRRAEGILGADMILQRTSFSGSKALVRDLLCVAPMLGYGVAGLLGRNLACGVMIRSEWEQAPVPENRVALGSELDRFGIPRVELHWKRLPHDVDTIVRNARIVAEEMAEAEIGRVRLDDWVDDEELPYIEMSAAWHHMGGTIMSALAETGIVDPQCRVHGLENLYVCGSSVFPSGGWANPTFTIVKLSLRLAEHLDGRLA